MPQFSAKLTSKNQLTLPAGVSALLHVRPGDSVTFTAEEGSSEIRVSGPDMDARLRAWAGRWSEAGGDEPDRTDAWIRELRGERD
jgi:bifunctional DNA-binding transcriptional regulator/antitoxin component of YhaV-PrlF toxin-antitoxin module